MNSNGKGIIFIVDISGYSAFVNQVKMETGMEVIGNPFNAIIEENHLALKISEVEGDAIFFYQFGDALMVEKILWQYRRMLKRFREVLYSFKHRYPSVQALNLKAIHSLRVHA